MDNEDIIGETINKDMLEQLENLRDFIVTLWQNNIIKSIHFDIKSRIDDANMAISKAKNFHIAVRK